MSRRGVFCSDPSTCQITFWFYVVYMPPSSQTLMLEFIQPFNLFFRGQDHLTEEFNDYIQIHLIAWQHLAAICEGKALRLFKLRPKHHQCDHTRTQTARTKLNPRRVMQCFGDESFLGYWKQIGVKCHASSVLTRIYQRYLMFLSLRCEMSRAIDYTGRVLEKQRGCTLTLQFHALTRWFGFVSKIGFTTTLHFLHLTSGDKHMGFGDACIFETNPFWTTWSGWCAGHNHWISQRVIVGQPKWWECFMYPDVYI